MIAQAGADIGLGMIQRGIQNREQLVQQGKLNEQQFSIDGRALARQKAAELQQWKDTSYGAQLEEMKKNNLSPGMMYGAAGGGAGQLGGSAGSVAAPKAAVGNGMDLMTVAQRKLIEAQTENVKVDTAKKAGVDTELVRQQSRNTEIAANLAAMTQEEAAQQMQAKSHILWEEAKAAKGMISAELQKKQAEVIGANLANELRKVEKDMTEAQMVKIANEIAQKWKELEIKQGHLDIQKFVQDVSNSTKLTVEAVSRAAGMLLKR